MKNKLTLILIGILGLLSCEKEKDFEGTACFDLENVENIQVNQAVTFTNCSVGGSYYYWDFGDGETSTGESPTHTYSNSGSYTVTLTIQNSELKDVNGDGLVNHIDAFESSSASMELIIQVKEN